MASSMRLGLSSGPSMRSCKVSKFHFMWSFVSMTCTTDSINLFQELDESFSYLSFQQSCLEGLVIHLQAHLDLDLLYMPLTPAKGVFHRVCSGGDRIKSATLRIDDEILLTLVDCSSPQSVVVEADCDSNCL